MISQATIDALRTTKPTAEQDRELSESIRLQGWLPHNQAIIDENGVKITGNRRLKFAALHGKEPDVLRKTYGEGEEADNRRIQDALASNVGSAPATAADKEALAVSLALTENWTQERIARIVHVSQKMVSKYLAKNLEPGSKLPPRQEKRGRPRGSVPKPIEVPVENVAIRPMPAVEVRVAPTVRVPPETTDDLEEYIAELEDRNAYLEDLNNLGDEVALRLILLQREGSDPEMDMAALRYLGDIITQVILQKVTIVANEDWQKIERAVRLVRGDGGGR